MDFRRSNHIYLDILEYYQGFIKYPYSRTKQQYEIDSFSKTHKIIRLHHGIISQEAKTRSVRTPLLHYYHLPFLSTLRRISSFSSTSNQNLYLYTFRERSLLSSLLKWFVSSFFLYLPTKRETKLPHSIFSNCCSPLNLTDIVTPAWPQEQHLVAIPFSSYQRDFFFFSFDGLCRYISCPHILNLNVSLSNSQTVTLHIMDASLEISKLYPSSSPGQGFGKNIEVLSFLITTISTSPHFHQPYSLCSVLWRFWPPEINPKYCVSYLYTSNIQIIPL